MNRQTKLQILHSAAQNTAFTNTFFDGFGGLVVSMLASGSRVQTRPKSLDFFGHLKNPPHAFFGGEEKESVPCPSFAACKRT